MGAIGALPFSCAVLKLHILGISMTCERRRFAAVPVVVPILCDVPHPRKCLIAALLDHLQIPHLNARDCEVRYLESYGDRSTFIVVILLYATVNIVLTKDMIMRHRPPRTLGRPKCARIRYSLPPPSCFSFHTKADFAGTYWTVPVAAYETYISDEGSQSQQTGTYVP